ELAEHYVELAKERYGENQPDFAPALLLLAQLYAAQGRPADAETLFKKALGIRETALGPEHLLVADALVHLAYSYQSQTRYQDAEAGFNRALAIREKSFGPDSREIVSSLEALAGLYEATGRKAEADQLWARVHRIEQNSPEPHFMLMDQPSYAVV